MFVVYDHPKDYPDDFIVRRFIALDGEAVPQEIVYRGHSLDNARSRIMNLAPSAVRFHRNQSDERQIVECWI